MSKNKVAAKNNPKIYNKKDHQARVVQQQISESAKPSGSHPSIEFLAKLNAINSDTSKSKKFKRKDHQRAEVASVRFGKKSTLEGLSSLLFWSIFFTTVYSASADGISSDPLVALEKNDGDKLIKDQSDELSAKFKPVVYRKRNGKIAKFYDKDDCDDDKDDCDDDDKKYRTKLTMPTAIPTVIEVLSDSGTPIFSIDSHDGCDDDDDCEKKYIAKSIMPTAIPTVIEILSDAGTPTFSIDAHDGCDNDDDCNKKYLAKSIMQASIPSVTETLSEDGTPTYSIDADDGCDDDDDCDKKYLAKSIMPTAIPTEQPLISAASNSQKTNSNSKYNPTLLLESRMSSFALLLLLLVCSSSSIATVALLYNRSKKRRHDKMVKGHNIGYGTTDEYVMMHDIESGIAANENKVQPRHL